MENTILIERSVAPGTYDIFVDGRLVYEGLAFDEVVEAVQENL